MLRVGICDDVAEHVECVETILKTYMEQKKIKCRCMSFENGKSLWYEVEDGTEFDLLFLDIEMPEMDGMELAWRIKKEQPRALIVFVSSYEKYVYDSFRVQPYRFIPKNRIEEMLTQVLDDAMEDVRQGENEFYLVENQQGIERIPVGDIVYIWHEGKYAYIERSGGDAVKVRKTLKQIYGEVSREEFVWAGRSYLCNLMHIVQVKGEGLKLSTGEQLYISNGKIADLKQQILNYWTKG